VRRKKQGNWMQVAEIAVEGFAREDKTRSEKKGDELQMCFMENKLDETGMKWKEHA
jgi:uncharacterized Zn finger protein